MLLIGSFLSNLPHICSLEHVRPSWGCWLMISQTSKHHPPSWGPGDTVANTGLQNALENILMISRQHMWAVRIQSEDIMKESGTWDISWGHWQPSQWLGILTWTGCRSPGSPVSGCGGGSTPRPSHLRPPSPRASCSRTSSCRASGGGSCPYWCRGSTCTGNTRSCLPSEREASIIVMYNWIYI